MNRAVLIGVVSPILVPQLQPWIAIVEDRCETEFRVTGWEKLIGYARVSTKNQHTDRQEHVLLAAGARRDDLYVDHGVTGAGGPEFDRAVPALHEGDTLMVTTLHRLGRSTCWLCRTSCGGAAPAFGF